MFYGKIFSNYFSHYYSMTYLTKEDWTNNLVPKISDDKSFSEHINQNIKIQNNFNKLISRILETNCDKKISQRILISCMIYYQKYILFNNIANSDLSNLDKLILYCACIFLALKEANKLLSIDFLSSKFQSYFNKIKSFDITEIKDLIIQKEFELLVSIEFDIGVEWPFQINNLLKNYLKKLGKIDEIIINIIRNINLNINDSLLFPLCLYYTPNEIVFSCILLAKKKYNLDYININDLIKLSKSEIDVDNIKECSLYISKIIKYKDILKDSNNINKNSSINDKTNNNCLQKDKGSLNFKNVALIQSNTN